MNQQLGVSSSALLPYSFPAELSRKLAAYCDETGEDLQNIVTDVMEEWAVCVAEPRLMAFRARVVKNKPRPALLRVRKVDTGVL